MKMTFALLCFLALSISPTIAQETPKNETPSEEAPKQEAPKPATASVATPKKSVLKYEVNASYTYRRFTEESSQVLNMNGWTLSGVYKWKSWVNAEVAFSGAYGRTFPTNAASTSESIYTAFAGPRFSWPGRHKVTPFAHILFGEGYYRRVTSAFGGFGASTYNDPAYAYGVGGGLDVTLRHSDHWAIHLIQVDADQTRFVNGYSGQRNIRYSTGITYRFGER
jgi:hypothetical protein